jgi:hypothetical protein
MRKSAFKNAIKENLGKFTSPLQEVARELLDKKYWALDGFNKARALLNSTKAKNKEYTLLDELRANITPMTRVELPNYLRSKLTEIENVMNAALE